MERPKIFFRIGLATVLGLALLGGFFPGRPEGNFGKPAFAKTKSSRKIQKKSKKKKAAEDSQFSFPVKIIGNADCVGQTNSALTILQKKSSEDYEKTAKNIGVVECAGNGSGVFIFENPARFKVGRATYQADPFWYASVLLHESCHVDQYRNYFFSRPGERVPSDIFSGADAENECLLAQYDCLVRLEAGQSLLEYVKKIAETSYWDVPAEKRWW